MQGMFKNNLLATWGYQSCRCKWDDLSTTWRNIFWNVDVTKKITLAIILTIFHNVLTDKIKNMEQFPLNFPKKIALVKIKLKLRRYMFLCECEDIRNLVGIPHLSLSNWAPPPARRNQTLSNTGRTLYSIASFTNVQ